MTQRVSESDYPILAFTDMRSFQAEIRSKEFWKENPPF